MPARAACLFTIWGPTLFEHYPFLPSHDCVAGLERPASASGLVPRSLQAVQSPVRPFSPVSGQASAPCFPCRQALARTQFGHFNFGACTGSSESNRELGPQRPAPAASDQVLRTVLVLWSRASKRLTRGRFPTPIGKLALASAGHPLAASSAIYCLLAREAASCLRRPAVRNVCHRGWLGQPVPHGPSDAPAVSTHFTRAGSLAVTRVSHQNPCWLTVPAVSTWCWLTGHNLKSRQPSVPVADSRAGNCDLISGDIETQLAISTCPGPLACCCCNSLKLLLLCVPLSHLPCSCISESRSVTRDWLSSLPQSGSASTRSMPTPSTGGHRLL